MIHKMLFWFLVLANLGGAIYGFVFFYGDQLASTGPLLWIFVADCPLYALLFGIMFFFRARGRPEILRAWFGRVPDLSALWFISFVGAMKYGFWTVFVLSVYTGFYFTPDAGLLYTILFGAHLFLLFETTLMVGKVKAREGFVLISLVWFIVNDVSDYVLGTHPPLPESALGFMFPATVGMTVIFTLLSYLVLMKWSREFSR